MVTKLRKIIVDATSEMLDNPDKDGIYPTTRFYNRLEGEVTDYFKNVGPHPNDIFALVSQTVEKSADITPLLQSAIADYLKYLSHPMIYSDTSLMAKKLVLGD